MWVKKDPIFFYRGEILYVKFPENRIAYYDHYISGVEPYSKEVSPDIVYKVKVINSFFPPNGIIKGEYSNGSFIDSKLQGYQIVIYPNIDTIYKWDGDGVPVYSFDTTSERLLKAKQRLSIAKGLRDLDSLFRFLKEDKLIKQDSLRHHSSYEPDYESIYKRERLEEILNDLEEQSLFYDEDLINLLNQLQPIPMNSSYGPIPMRRSSVAKMGGKSNTIKLGGKKKVNIPKKYTKGLKKKDKVTQENDIKKAMKGYKKGKYIPRRKFKTFKNKPSTYTTKFKELYPNAKTLKEISKVTGIPLKAIKEVKKKGMGAYYSSGSRPNQTAQSWGMARVYSYILGGKTRKPDQHITEKYNVKFKHNIKFK